MQMQMEEKIDTAEKKVLVDIVKLAQKRGLKGKLGGWKEFLASYDKKFGDSLSDPAKRPHDILAAFLKTFSKEDDLKFFANMMQRHSNKDILEHLKANSHDSPEKRLVQLTLQHPLYPLDYSFASFDEGWVIISLKNKTKVMRSTEMVAVDCEMVLCEDGTEALVKVCVVDRNLEVKLHELVKPNKAIADYRTEITDVSSQDLEGVTCSLADIQKSMKKLLSKGTILVGHSLHNDLNVLKLDHVKVIDTSYIFQSLDGPINKRPSLNSLCKAVLGYEVRESGAAHNCLDDARAAMKLVLAKIKLGFDRVIPLVQEQVLESEIAKLLLHRIPISVKCEELHKVVPGDCMIELKPSRKAQGEKYSAFAIFKNPQEAHDAYENVQGSQEKDSSGLPQKLVTFRLSTGMTASIFVRKMAPGGLQNRILSKRAFQVDEAFDVSKKAKMDCRAEEAARTGSGKGDSEARLNEIETLNQRLKQSDSEIESLRQQLKQSDSEIESLGQQLKQKDFEITMLHKMVSNLKQKTKKKM